MLATVCTRRPAVCYAQASIASELSFCSSVILAARSGATVSTLETAKQWFGARLVEMKGRLLMSSSGASRSEKGDCDAGKRSGHALGT
jgi:hypothetical protein